VRRPRPQDQEVATPGRNRGDPESGKNRGTPQRDYNLVTATNAAGGITARAYISAVPAITEPLIDTLLTRSAVDGETVVSRMPAPERTRLADALDATAAARPQG